MMGEPQKSKKAPSGNVMLSRASVRVFESCSFLDRIGFLETCL